ncbi:MAG: rhodanese-like domain-containing protein [Bacteroidota bacterium]
MELETNGGCQISRWELHKRMLDNLSPERFGEAMAEEGNIILDVRTASEFQYYHLPNAINLDYLAEDFLDRLEALDASRTYCVYCRSGRRSTRVCTLMANSGFTKVLHLDGGLNQWEAHFKQADKHG